MPDVPFSRPICDKDGDHVGIVGESMEPLVNIGNLQFVYLSKWQPQHLMQNFSTSFFKVYPIDGNLALRDMLYCYNLTDKSKSVGMNKVSRTYSAVGRQTYHSNQKQFLYGKCFILLINNWQVLDKHHRVLYNSASKKRSGDYTNCVAFSFFRCWTVATTHNFRDSNEQNLFLFSHWRSVGLIFHPRLDPTGLFIYSIYFYSALVIVDR